jgi:signal transduction histidine kinase
MLKDENIKRGTELMRMEALRCAHGGTGEVAGAPSPEEYLRGDECGVIPFEYVIAHEMKSPLRAIDGYARMSAGDRGSALSPDAAGMLESIRRICRETICLADRLLEYARMTRGTLLEEAVNLESMIRDVFDLLRAEDGTCCSAKLIFVSEIPDVLADPFLMRQVIKNIMSNSLKFAIDGSLCEIRIGCEEIDGEDVFFFSDNGAGFDMRCPASPFEMFQRMHRAGEFEGSGVGLAIVKKAVTMHGGKTWIRGEVGKGVTVYFTLPSGKVLC